MWIFGYGSLMWDCWEDRLGGVRADRAILPGYRRSFNKKSVKNCGTSKVPAPTLGLEPSAEATRVGSAFQFPDGQRQAVKNYLTDREGPSFDLLELPVRLPDGQQVRAFTPVNDRT